MPGLTGSLPSFPTWYYYVTGAFYFVAIGFLVAAWKTRKRKYALGAGIAVALIVLASLFVFMFPSDQQLIESAVFDMSKGVKEKNADQVFSHIADDFRFGFVDKPTLRKIVEGAFKRGDVNEVYVWEFRDAEISRKDKNAVINFYVRPRGSRIPDERAYYTCKAKFVLESDDKWRLKSFELFNPFVDTDQPIQIPNLQQ
jgi:hypothetical protein